jgi:hypothetical protein
MADPYKNDLTTLAARLRPLMLGMVENASNVGGGSVSHQFIYELPDAFTVDTGGLRAYNRFGSTLTIAEVHCSVSAAVAGSAVIVDVHKNGTTIFTTQGNRPQIAIGANAGSSSTIDVTSFAHGDYLTVDVDQGTGTDLAVVILVE